MRGRLATSVLDVKVDTVAQAYFLTGRGLNGILLCLINVASFQLTSAPEEDVGRVDVVL